MRYHLSYRLIPLFYFAVFIQGCVVTLLAVYETSVMVADVDSGRTLLVIIVMVALFVAPCLLLTMWGVRGLRRYWFLRREYRCIGMILEVYDPLLKTRFSINLDEVEVIRSFTLPHKQHGRRNPIHGKMLITKEEQYVLISEELPSWPDIAAKLSHARTS